MIDEKTFDHIVQIVTLLTSLVTAVGVTAGIIISAFRGRAAAKSADEIKQLSLDGVIKADEAVKKAEECKQAVNSHAPVLNEISAQVAQTSGTRTITKKLPE